MAGTAQVTKRLQADLMELMMHPIPGISAFPHADSLLQWKGTIDPSDSSVYAGMQFRLDLAFPAAYPLTAPTVKFETPIFHPNIDMSGNICLDILKDKWSPTYNVSTLLLSIQGLLDTPNNDSPLNNQAAQLWNDREKFLKLAKRRYANLPLS
ncbi:unnamed protein product [Agarophyton chilense]